MKKKPFWKRANRGFLASLALIVCVLVYVLVTQLMLLSEKNELKGLTNSVRDLALSVHVISDEKLQSLTDPAALEQEKARLEKELEPLFDPSSDYFSRAAESLLVTLPQPDGKSERVRTSEESKKPHIRRCIVDGDVATIQVVYTYAVTGDFYNYDKYHGNDDELFTPQPVESATEELSIIMTCKKIDGQWKIFRISDLSTHSYEHVFKEAVS